MLNQEIVARYNFLLSEAEDVERKLQFMAENIKDSDEEMEETVVGNITDLNSKLEQIQQDVEILLNPSTRYRLLNLLSFLLLNCYNLDFSTVLECYFSALK
jgi:protein subunit release factor A